MVAGSGIQRWQRLEAWLEIEGLRGGDQFMHSAVMQGLGVSGREASLIIQAHLDAQVIPDSTTRFLIRRLERTRTTTAVWHITERAADTRALGTQWVDDAKRRIERVVEPTIAQIAVRNPKAARTARGVAKAIGNCLEIMGALLDSDA